MATVRERLIYAIEVVTDRAQTGFKGFRQSVAEADGAVGKFKAGTSSAMATVQANAGTLALAGGAALVAFGTKAVNAFQETALAAGKFSDATGLAVEDASRWAEVAGDVGISVETIQGSFVRLNKAIADGKLDEFGVSAQRAADGTVDVNETMLEAIRVIGAIKDPTERAAAAQAAFGRSYAQAAEIIFDSAENVEQKLGDVSEQKVISEDELAKAREFRESMDNLKDAAEDVALVAGEVLVPVLGDLADFLVNVTDAAGDAKGAIEDLPGGESLLDALGTNLFELPGKSKEAWDDLGRKIGVLPDELENVEQAAEDTAPAIEEVAAAADKAGEATGTKLAGELLELQDTLQEAAGGAARFADALEEALVRKTEEAADRFDAAIDRVLTRIDEAFAAVEGRFEQQDILAGIAEGWEDIAVAEKEAAKGGERERREFERQIRDQRRAVLDFLGTIKSIPASQMIELATEIETASLDELKGILAALTEGIQVPVSFVQPPNQAFESVGGSFAPGVAPTPIFNGQSAIPAGNVTIIYPTGSTPTTTIQNEIDYSRRNGAR